MKKAKTKFTKKNHWNYQRLAACSSALLAVGLSATALRASAADAPPAAKSKGDADLMALDLESLSSEQVNNTASYTKTDEQHAPVTMTTLDAKVIEETGARDLNHLLEMEIPNAEFISHHSDQDHMGIRGTISDREDKYLYQVNGRTMNMRLLNGAASSPLDLAGLTVNKNTGVITFHDSDGNANNGALRSAQQVPASVNGDGNLVFTHLNGGADGTDVVANVEVLRFMNAHADTTLQGSVMRLAEAVSGTAASSAAVQGWMSELKAGATLEQVAQHILAANAAQQPAGDAEIGRAHV